MNPDGITWSCVWDYSADATCDGQLNASDRAATWNARNLTGYLGADVTSDGQANASDHAQAWNNANKDAQVP